MEYAGVLVRNFIPAKRNSDNVLGLYDLVNNVFYTNAGSGTFIAGPEVPKTIKCHLISPIKTQGVWTITATSDTETVSKDVLVDSIALYDVKVFE